MRFFVIEPVIEPVIEHTAQAPRVRGAVRRLLALALLVTTTGGLGAQDDFKLRVDRAIERGRRHLEEQFRGLVANPPGDHRMGRIALPLTALLQSGMAADDPLARQALEFLDGLAPQETYDVACYLFALDVLWQAKVRAVRQRSGPTYVRPSRKARGKVLAKIVELVRWLVDARVRGAGSWDYRVGRARYDYSNSQFAILGLQVGIEHGVRIPREVFLEIVQHYMKTQRVDGPVMELQLTFNPPVEAAFSKTYVARQSRFRGQPGGWNYQGTGQKPYASMTAAGTSNLLVARHALEKLGGLGSSMRRQLERSILGGLAWMTHRFDDYVHGNHRFYYTIYSLEKVGDLGDVAKFGKHDWYREGAEELMRRQGGDGGWGSYVDTSFALLFLTRATRAHMRGLPPPTIFTVTGKEKGRSQIGDLVFVDNLKAFISAGEFFAYLAETRKRELISTAEQVVRNYALDRQDELIPHLVALWTQPADAVATFARRALAQITGVRKSDPDFYRGWYKHYLAVVAFLESGSTDTDRLGKLLADAPGVRLKQRLLDFIERRRLTVATGHLVDELLVPDEEYRRRVHGILVSFTGRDLPFAESGSREAREEEAARWRDWWEGNRGELEKRHRIRRLVERLNSDASPDGREEDRTALLEALVGEGRAAIPFILDGLARRRYRIELILALERITGKRLGLLAEPWQRWWRESGGT